MISSNRSSLQEPLLNKSSRKYKVLLFMSCLLLMFVFIAFFNSHDENVPNYNEIVVLAQNNDEIILQLNDITKQLGEVSKLTKVTQTITQIFSFGGYIGTALSTALSAFHFFTDYQNDRYIKAIKELSNQLEENQRETMEALGKIQMDVWKSEMSEPYTIMKDLHIQLKMILETGEVDKCSIQQACDDDFSRCRVAFNKMNTVAQAMINEIESNAAYDYNIGNYKGKLDTSKSQNLLQPIMYTIMQSYIDISQAQAFLSHPYNSSSPYDCNSTISIKSMKKALFTFEIFMNQTLLHYQTLAYKMRQHEYQQIDFRLGMSQYVTGQPYTESEELKYITGIYIGGWWMDNIDGFMVSRTPEEIPAHYSDSIVYVNNQRPFDSVGEKGSCYGLRNTNFSWFLIGLELIPYNGRGNYGIENVRSLICAKMNAQNGTVCRNQSVNANPGNWIGCSEPGEYIGSMTRSHNKNGLDSIGEIECCRPTFDYTPIYVQTEL